MIPLTLSVQNGKNQVLSASSGEGEVCLVYEEAYAPGDTICVQAGSQDIFLVVQLDDALAPAYVFLRGGICVCPVPFGEARSVYSPRAYAGGRHYLHARAARPDEIASRKNLAFNPYATHEPGGPFPYASANVETRGEMVFAAKNAIDGIKAGSFHGEWPYTSWGINRDPKAAWRLDFGRNVLLDEAVFYLRADFPHDAWWEQATLRFSNGDHLTVSLRKTSAGQAVVFPEKQVEWVVLEKLMKAEDPSPFPALTQMEFYGRDS